MDIVKKNLISIICGVVALLAIFAYAFYPLGGWVSELKDQTEVRAKVYGELETLRTKPRHLPNISLENSEQPPLEQFPSNAIIEEGGKVTDQVHAEAAAMQKTAVDLNRHKPLLENVLPISSDNMKFLFKQQYANAMARTIPETILDATSPPTPAEIDHAADELWKREFKDRIIIVNGQPDPENQKQIEEDFREKAAKLPMELRTRGAREHRIYMLPGTFAPIAAMGENVAAAPSPVDIWTAQLKYWVQEDIARAIASVNEGAKGVPDAPIKHLVRVAIPDDFVAASAAAPAGNGQEDPNAAPAQGGPLPKNVAISPTGRTSNRVYDVMRFTIEINCDARQIPYVLNKMTQNQFFTVVNVVSVSGIDSAAAAANGYYYGNAPVAHLMLDCETLYMREWTVPYMPEPIKRKMGIVTAAPPGVQAMAQ
jgi:hypothetical protein